MTRFRPAAASAVLLVAGLTAACSSSGAPAHRTHSVSDRPLPPPPTSNGPTQPSAPPAVTASAPPSTSSSRSTPGSAPATKGTSGLAARRSTCAAVTIRVIRGSADVGREIAALQFTNAGSQPCTLYGYPTVALLRHGRAFGAPAQPATSATSMRRLAPGATAESLLIDYTNCQARLSEQIQVVVPGSAQAAVRPAQLRACTLRVAALGAPQ